MLTKFLKDFLKEENKLKLPSFNEIEDRKRSGQEAGSSSTDSEDSLTNETKDEVKKPGTSK